MRKKTARSKARAKARARAHAETQASKSRATQPWKQPELTPDQRAKAVARLKQLLTMVSQPPESILEILDRAGIRWERINSVPGDPKYDTIVFKVSDLEAGEQRLREQGSIAKRIYGANIDPSRGLAVKGG